MEEARSSSRRCWMTVGCYVGVFLATLNIPLTVFSIHWQNYFNLFPLMYGILYCAAPVAGIIINRFSCRACIITGGICTIAGIFLLMIAPTLDQFKIIAGIFIGFGSCASSCGFTLAVGYYNKRFRNCTIAGILLIFQLPECVWYVSPSIFHTISQSDGLRFICRAMNVYLLVFGSVLKPIDVESNIRSERKEESRQVNKATVCFNKYIDVSVLLNKSLILFLLSIITWTFALTLAYEIFQFDNYASPNTVQWNIFICVILPGGICGIVASELLNTHLLLIQCVVTISFCMATAVLILPISYGTFIFGLASQLTCGLLHTTMVNISLTFTGVSRMTEALTFSFLTFGMGCLLIPISIGQVGKLDPYEKYVSYITGGVILMSVLFSGLSLKLRDITKPDEDEPNVDHQNQIPLIDTSV